MAVRTISRPTASHHGVTGDVDGQVPDGRQRGRRFAPAPAECSQPGEQLAEVKRLREVVVGAGIEAGDAVLDRVEGGQHQHRNSVSLLAKRRTNDNAALARQENVERMTASYSLASANVSACGPVDAWSTAYPPAGHE